MKIVQIITELLPAGAERIVAELSKGLQSQGHSVCVISLRPIPDKSVIVDELQESQIAVYSLNMQKHTPWRLFSLRSLLKKLQPDIVHSHLFHANIVARCNARKRFYKLINSVHIAEKRRNKRWYFRLDKWTLSWCDSMSVVSHAVQQFHAQQLNIPPMNLPVVYNGIALPQTLSSEEITQMRQQWQVADCKKILGCVGRLDWQKGFDFIFQVLPELEKYIPDQEKWALVIIGEGVARDTLEKLATKVSPQWKIILPGFRADAAACMSAFDIFVMPSRYEGFGLTLVEAMTHGIPVVANNADSLPELLEDYPNGQVVDFVNDSANSIAKVIYETLQKPRIARHHPYSIKAMIEGYLELYGGKG